MVHDVAYEVIGTKIAADAPLMSAGLDSISATEFTGELATHFSVDLAPTILFDHPTLESLASFISDELTSHDVATTPTREEERPLVAQVPAVKTKEQRNITLAAWDFTIAGGITTPSELRSLSMRALEVNTSVPLARWATPTPGAKPSAA